MSKHDDYARAEAPDYMKPYVSKAHFDGFREGKIATAWPWLLTAIVVGIGIGIAIGTMLVKLFTR